jgi:hypothetical protein
MSLSLREKRTIGLVVLLVAIAVGISFVVDAIEERNATWTASLTVMNYTDVDVAASVAPAEKPLNAGYGSGDSVGPRAGGTGANCCIELPIHWRPGIKVKVKYRFSDWAADRFQVEIVDLPPYPEGKGGNLWLSFFPDRSFEALSSHYGPEDPGGRWPGRVKHFPASVSSKRAENNNDITPR